MTAIDTSGNESAPSAIASGSTNPPQLAGFPILLGDDIASSPVVGDIDGDGDLEIVQCADKVYAFHADGTEVIDGDGDAQTWGVLSPLGTKFVSHPALAQLDGAPGLEIVAASRDLKRCTPSTTRVRCSPGGRGRWRTRCAPASSPVIWTATACWKWWPWTRRA